MSPKKRPKGVSFAGHPSTRDMREARRQSSMRIKERMASSQQSKNTKSHVEIMLEEILQRQNTETAAIVAKIAEDSGVMFGSRHKDDVPGGKFRMSHRASPRWKKRRPKSESLSPKHLSRSPSPKTREYAVPVKKMRLLERRHDQPEDEDNANGSLLSGGHLGVNSGANLHGSRLSPRPSLLPGSAALIGILRESEAEDALKSAATQMDVSSLIPPIPIVVEETLSRSVSRRTSAALRPSTQGFLGERVPLGDFTVVGRVKVQSSFPRTLDSIKITLTGQSVADFTVSMEKRYRKRTNHVSTSTTLRPTPQNAQLSSKSTCILEFVIPITAEEFAGALCPQVLITVSSFSTYKITCLKYMAFAQRPMEEEQMIAGKSRWTLNNFVCETWYSLEAEVSLVAPIGLNKFMSSRFRIGDDLAPIEPSIVQALFRPSLVDSKSVGGNGMTMTARMPTIIKNESTFDLAISVVPDGTTQASQLEVSAIKVELRQWSKLFFPDFGFIRTLAVKDATASFRVRLLKWDVPYYILTKVGKPQSIPLTITRVLPTSSYNPSFTTSHTIRITATLSNKSLLSLFKSTPLTPLVIEFPIIVSPYLKDYATVASSVAPWLFLPTEEGVELPSASIQLPPNCWRAGENVEGDLPTYAEAVR
ncbi:hypothetical protein HDU97_000613 [Phlyctochytrium planicorne]|nr:hypothetical protein HDU97_000613 [Phlyctochytrium planicorne]